MAIDFCNLAEALACNPSPDDEMFKVLVLRALLGLVTVAAPSESPGVTSNVASSATSVNLVPANSARKGLTIFNDSTQILRIKYGATASSTDFTVAIAAGGVFNMPTPIYGGQIDGIWAAANGFARITEF